MNPQLVAQLLPEALVLDHATANEVESCAAAPVAQVRVGARFQELSGTAPRTPAAASPVIPGNAAHLQPPTTLTENLPREMDFLKLADGFKFSFFRAKSVQKTCNGNYNGAEARTFFLI